VKVYNRNSAVLVTKSKTKTKMISQRIRKDLWKHLCLGNGGMAFWHDENGVWGKRSGSSGLSDIWNLGAI